MNTFVLTALVKMSVFFVLLHFSFFLFFNFHFWGCFWLVSQKFRKYQKPKQAKQKTRTKGIQKMQSKHKWYIMILNKARQQAEQQKPKNNLKQESRQNKKEKQEPETEMKNRKEGNKKRTRERQRNRERERERERNIYIYIYIYMLWSYYLVQVWGF